MRRRRTLQSAATALVLAVLISLSSTPAPAHADAAGSSAITTWDGGCGGSTRDWWDDMCMEWRHEMADFGFAQWARNYNLVQGNRYADNSAKAWGIDDTGMGLDGNEAGMMCLHGGWQTGRWNGTLHDPDPDGSCAAQASNMRVGKSSGGFMRFLHLSSCNSNRFSQRSQWFDAAKGVHVITGFHGLMYIGYWYVGEYSDLADEGFVRGVGKVWLDDMHHVDHWYNVYKTICPVVSSFGKTKELARLGLDEPYGFPFPEPSSNFMNVRWIAGCDPDDGPALPN